MSKGTVSDKVAAFIVSVQDNPVYNLEALRNLVGMVNVAKKKECLAVIGKYTTILEGQTKIFFQELPASF